MSSETSTVMAVARPYGGVSELVEVYPLDGTNVTGSRGVRWATVATTPWLAPLAVGDLVALSGDLIPHVMESLARGPNANVTVEIAPLSEAPSVVNAAEDAVRTVVLSIQMMGHDAHAHGAQHIAVALPADTVDTPPHALDPATLRYWRDILWQATIDQNTEMDTLVRQGLVAWSLRVRVTPHSPLATRWIHPNYTDVDTSHLSPAVPVSGAVTARDIAAMVRHPEWRQAHQQAVAAGEIDECIGLDTCLEWVLHQVPARDRDTAATTYRRRVLLTTAANQALRPR